MPNQLTRDTPHGPDAPSVTPGLQGVALALAWHATTLAALAAAGPGLLAWDALAGRGRNAAARVSAWLEARAGAISNLNGLLTDLRTGPAPDFATLSVALESVRHLPGAES